MTQPQYEKPSILVCEAYEGLQEAFRLMLDDWASTQIVSKTAEWLPVLATSQWDLFVLDLDGQTEELLELVRNIRLADLPRLSPAQPSLRETGGGVTQKRPDQGP